MFRCYFRGSLWNECHYLCQFNCDKWKWMRSNRDVDCLFQFTREKWTWYCLGYFFYPDFPLERIMASVWLYWFLYYKLDYNCDILYWATKYFWQMIHPLHSSRHSSLPSPTAGYGQRRYRRVWFLRRHCMRFLTVNPNVRTLFWQSILARL